ncbi:MAG: alkaline phosphatase D family protein [Bacteroidota bacterium]
MKRSLLLLIIVALSLQVWAQKEKPADLLLSGPMVGYTEMREAMLWVQTNGPAQVYFEYKEKDSEAKPFRTERYTTTSENVYTAHLVANSVQPGKTYEYTLFINGKAVERPYPTTFKTPPLWQFRTDPPTMRIALGSCTFINDEAYDRPGKGYGDGYQIFESIRKQTPDLMLWLGDNIYLREADFYSKTGILHRYTHTRKTPEMQALLASTSNYAIWDDHDYGPNNSDYTFRERDFTLEAFKYFWGNPGYGVQGQKGTTTMFERGDAQFFMLDNRYFRDPNNKKTGARSILGKEQLDWFTDALISSNATWKFVAIGGQVLNSYPGYENYAAISPEERLHIINTIFNEGIRNVIFLTGDRHHSEVSKMERNGITIYDITTSPLTSGSHDAEKEPNSYRVQGSQIGVRNFSVMEITGERLSRKLALKFYDSDGKELYTYDIEAQYRPRR